MLKIILPKERGKVGTQIIKFNIGLEHPMKSNRSPGLGIMLDPTIGFQSISNNIQLLEPLNVCPLSEPIGLCRIMRILVFSVESECVS